MEIASHLSYMTRKHRYHQVSLAKWFQELLERLIAQVETRVLNGHYDEIVLRHEVAVKQRFPVASAACRDCQLAALWHRSAGSGGKRKYAFPDFRIQNRAIFLSIESASAVHVNGLGSWL